MSVLFYARANNLGTVTISARDTWHRSEYTGYLGLLSWRFPFDVELLGVLHNLVDRMIKFAIPRVVDVVFVVGYDDSSRVGGLGGRFDPSRLHPSFGFLQILFRKHMAVGVFLVLFRIGLHLAVD